MNARFHRNNLNKNIEKNLSDEYIFKNIRKRLTRKEIKDLTEKEPYCINPLLKIILSRHYQICALLKKIREDIPHKISDKNLEELEENIQVIHFLYHNALLIFINKSHEDEYDDVKNEK